MKKLLALVLALVMSMSLVTISNAAFKDADKIDYKEAVDVMNAVGVFIGDEKGNFNAKENLTREQAAKIIAYLELGSKAADALVGSGTFADVAASRWSAGFVGYCAQAGVVAGVGDGKFDPAGQLTALQFGKMLLVEIGYDAKAAGMTGTDWAINTSKLMATTGLMKGIDGSVNQVLTREKAAQMTLNALKTPTVEYTTKGSSVTVNGAEINFGASVPTYVTNTIAKEQTISKDKLTNSGEYTIELGEKLYKDLKLVKDTTDAFERPTHEWYLKTTKIGAYAEAADLEYTAAVKVGTIYSDLGLSKGISKAKTTVYEDGARVTGGADDYDIVKGDITNKFGGNGAQTFVYYDDDAKSVTIVIINTYVAKIAAVRAATTTKDAYVVLNTGDSFTKPTSAVGNYETDAFAKDDIVAYTYSKKSGDDGVQSMYLTEKVTGKMSTYTTTGSVTVDGTKYDASTKSAANIYGFANSVDRNTEVSVYLDQFGYGLYVDADTTAQYAVVLAYEKALSTLRNDRAKLLFTDGTVKTVDVEKNSTAVAAYTANDAVVGPYDIVAYTIDSDDVYTLTLKADSQTSKRGGAFVLTNGNNVFEIAEGNKMNIKNSSGSSKHTKYADGETIFLVADVTDAAKPIYSVFTGFANVPTTTQSGSATTVAVFAKDNSHDAVADVVFILKDSTVTMTSDNKDLVFIKGNDNKVSYTTALGNYYEYDAIINGEETTIKTTSAFDKATLGYGPQYNEKGLLVRFEAYAYDGDQHGSVYYDGTNGTKAVKNSVIALNGTYYAVASDCVVYMINTSGELTKVDITSVTEDGNDEVWFKINDKDQLSALYIKVKDAPTTVDPATSGELTLKSVEYTTGKYTVKYQSTVDLDTADTYTVSIAKNGITITSADDHISSPVAAGSEASVDLSYNASSPAGTYTVTLTIKDDSANKTYSVVKTMVIG